MKEEKRQSQEKEKFFSEEKDYIFLLNFLKEGVARMRNTHLIVKNLTNPKRMKLKVVSGTHFKLFSTRKAQHLAQALTFGRYERFRPRVPST